MNQIDLTTLDVQALKALAYDLVVQGEQIRNNLATVQQQIVAKQQAEAKTEPPKE